MLIIFHLFLFVAFSYFLAPIAAYEHVIGHYEKYLYEYTAKDPEKYYFDDFERLKPGEGYIEEVDDDDDLFDDDTFHLENGYHAKDAEKYLFDELEKINTADSYIGIKEYTYDLGNEYSQEFPQEVA